MAGIDTSIYNMEPVKPVDPIDTMSRITGMSNSMLQNKLMQGKLGMGANFQSAIDPTTGLVDTNRLIGDTARNPVTAPLTGEAAQLGMELNSPMQVYDPQSKQIKLIPKQQFPSLSREKIDSLHDHYEDMNKTVNGLLDKPDLTTKDVVSAVGGLIANGRMTPKEAAKALSTMPQKDDQIKPWLENYKAQFQQGQQVFQQNFGPRGGVAAGPALGEEAAVAGAVANLNEMYNNVKTSGTRIAALKQALTGLEGANTGPGTETTNHLRSLLLAQTPELLQKFIPGIDKAKIETADYDKANKYLTQYATGLASQMGEGTDSKLAAAFTGNANTHISNLAARDVVKMTIGLERMQQAQGQAWEQSGLQPADFNKWQRSWNKDIDPRAFALPEMDKKDIAKMLKTMKPADEAKFGRTYDYAVKNGLIEEVQ